MPRCLIIDKMHPSIVKGLEDINVHVDYRPGITRKEILSVVGDYEGMIVRSKTTIDNELLVKAKSLKWVGRAGAGIDQLDMESLLERDITVINAPEGNQDALAEHAIGLILAVLNRFGKGDRQIRNNIWDREGNRGEELGNKTVGIIGYGHMGRSVSRRLTVFGCQILAYDKYRSGFGSEEVMETTLEEIFQEADILSLHVPLTDETFKMVNQEFLNRFKKNIYLINTARGEVVDLNDLNEALASGKVKGAGLDVLENEKLQDYSSEDRIRIERLKSFENVMITPHVGGWSIESYKRINDVLIQKIKALVEK
jgi:D-3-phosphoglycerate dehydrogenase